MSIEKQAARLGHNIVGKLTEVERDSREGWYRDDAGNLYGVRRGILTIFTADGRVL